MFDFPANPVVGQTYTSGLTTYTWTGYAWMYAANSGLTPVGNYVLKTGDVMSGFLTLHADPTLPLHAVTKSYTDFIGSSFQAQIVEKVSRTGDVMTGMLTLYNHPTENLHAATKGYADSKVVGLISDAPNDANLYGRQGAAWALAVKKAGDTLTGLLTLSGPPTAPLHAATKAYADTFLPKAGGIMTGPITLSAPPSATMHAATKLYVDETLAAATGGTITEAPNDGQLYGRKSLGWYTALAKGGDTMTGPLTLSGPPTVALHAATKAYVDGSPLIALKVDKAGDTMTGGLIIQMSNPFLMMKKTAGQPISIDGRLGDLSRWSIRLGDAAAESGASVGSNFGIYAYDDAGANPKLALYITRATGLVTLFGDATAALGAATKQYVDLRVLRSGDTMTGNLSIPQPLLPAHAVTKQYMEDSFGAAYNIISADVAAKVSKAGDTMSGNLTVPTPTAPLHAATKDYADVLVTARVLKAGDQMTGDLAITKANPTLLLSKALNSGAFISVKVGALHRWSMQIGDATAEGGASTGSNFYLVGFNDDNTINRAALFFSRATALGTVFGDPTAPLGIATKQYADTKYAKTGGILTGDVTVQKSYPVLNLMKPVSGEYCGIWTYTNGVPRWLLRAGDTVPESGLNNGSDWTLQRYADAGEYLGNAFTVYRANGAVAFSSSIIAKPGGGPFADTSDIRIKNIEGEYKKGLDAVLALRPITFTYKGNDTHDDPYILDDPDDPKKQIRVEGPAPFIKSTHYTAAVDKRPFVGFTAQELEGEFPECVSRGKGFVNGVEIEDLRTVDTGPLLYAIVNAIKELNAKIGASKK